MAGNPSSVDASRVLQLAVSDARVMGRLYLLVGGGCMVLAAVEGGWRALEAQIILCAASLLLLAPGIVYLLVARSLRHADATSATLGMRMACGHIAVILGALLVGAVVIHLAGMQGEVAIQRSVSVALIPAVVSAFFVPAKGVFLYHIIKARRAARVVSGPGSAFEVQPVAAISLPVEADVPGQPAAGDLIGPGEIARDAGGDRGSVGRQAGR